MSENYIVAFQDDVTEEQVREYAEQVKTGGGSIKEHFDSRFLNGFSATIPPTVLQSFQSFQGDIIKYIEPDSVVTIQ
ncbi:hypothetical protein DFH11DRAFT_1565378 [Phellopilus nigrolimitatus]|nr:hypothetical protein DFH11DRAFT_1565378 [Phellopilus nigrolimitatus]